MSTKRRIGLPSDWLGVLEDEFNQDYMVKLREFLQEEKQSGQTVYPPNALMFEAFNQTPLSKLKVVVVGQDPYHGPNQAHGLSFSVPKSTPVPPSLKNILKELEQDLQLKAPQHGNLSHWASQGVLLLNSVLSVRANQPGSHQNQGWERFTDAAISAVNEHKQHCVFILWGAYAKKKGKTIDQDKHLVLTAAHPSPLAANRGGFFGTKPFSKTNAYLSAHGQTPIQWTDT